MDIRSSQCRLTSCVSAVHLIYLGLLKCKNAHCMSAYKWQTGHRASISTRWHFAFGCRLSQQRNTRAPIANPPNGAQLGGTHTERHTHRRAWIIYISCRLRLTRNVNTAVSEQKHFSLCLNSTVHRRSFNSVCSWFHDTLCRNRKGTYCDFWATACKTFRSMLSHRYLSWPVLSVCL